MPTISTNPDGQSLVEALRAHQSECWRRGERVQLSFYLANNPDLKSDPDAVIALIQSEVALRLELGEKPTLEEYLTYVPEYAERLKNRWIHTDSTLTEHKPKANHFQTTITEGHEKNDRQKVASPSLPGFEIYERLGAGAMGVVYRAHDLRLQQPRAIKVIRTEGVIGKNAHDRFNREAQAVARLDHPGVVRILSFHTHADILHICMDFVDGGTLQDRLSQGPLGARDAAELVRELALAVQHAHERMVLHRDLKPGNVLMTSTGNPKITDFGLAKILDSDDELTRPGTVMGTPAYMAPEQVEARHDEVAEQTDIWALGIILYECLAGYTPFKGSDQAETMKFVRTQPPPPVAGVPAELEAIYHKCLEKKSRDRYASASQLAADLQCWLDGKPTSVRPPRGVRKVLRAVRRRPLLTGLALFLLTAGITAFFVARHLDPQRQMKLFQERFQKGERVELIGEKGGEPSWARWLIGKQEKKAYVDEDDGCFYVQTWPLAMLELLPNTAGEASYLIHAEVRHVKCGDKGSVGVYFASGIDPTTSRPALSFVSVSYDDIHDVLDTYNLIKEEVRKSIPKPAGNKVAATSCFYETDANNPILIFPHTIADPELFKPAGHQGKAGVWRTIEIHVSPSRVRVVWDGLLVFDRDPGKIDQGNKKRARIERSRRPQDALPEGFEAKLNWQGGIGLVVMESSASFRNVRIERVVPPESD